jgi:hypothetical protein
MASFAAVCVQPDTATKTPNVTIQMRAREGKRYARIPSVLATRLLKGLDWWRPGRFFRFRAPMAYSQERNTAK